MFGAVYFKGDGKFDILNCKKIKKLDGTIGVLNFEIGEKVNVSYKTNSIDDAGRDRIVDEDYEGVITFLHKDKSELAKFTEKEADIVRAWSNGTLKDFVENYKLNVGEASKRKKKKTEKMMSFMEDNDHADTKDNDKSVGSPVKSGETDVTKGTKASSKRKKPVPAVNPDSPSKSTRSKSLQKTAQDAAKETQKLETMEYFKKKKLMSDLRLKSTSNGHQPKQHQEQVTVPVPIQSTQTEQVSQPIIQPSVPIQSTQTEQVSQPIIPPSVPIQSTQTEQVSQPIIPPSVPIQSTQTKQVSQPIIPPSVPIQSTQTEQVSQPIIPPSVPIQSTQTKQVSQPIIPPSVPIQSTQTEHINQPYQLNQQSTLQLRYVSHQQQHQNLKHGQGQLQTSNQQQINQGKNQQLQYHQPYPLQQQQFHQEHQLPFDQQPTYMDMDSGVISQGLRTLNDDLECANCEINKRLISNLQNENEQLKTELVNLKDISLKGSVATDILSDLKEVIEKYEGNTSTLGKLRIYEKQLEVRKEVILENNDDTLDQSNSLLTDSLVTGIVASSSCAVDNDEDAEFTSLPASRSSTPIRKSSFNTDSIETVENFQSFLQPDKTKVNLVDGHSLYVDASQLQAMKNRSKKNPSRLVRELLSYFFTPEYLGKHSATGAKSTKKGLPVEIMGPIRVFMSKNYRFEETNQVTNRKCLDVNRKTERLTKQ